MNKDQDFDAFFRGRKSSRITEEFPDKAKFPLYYEAKRQEFVLNAGDMLYIPIGWWHFVFSEDPDPEEHINFAINFFYETPDDWEEGSTYKNEVPCVKTHNLPKINPNILLKDSIIKVFKSKKNYFVPESFYSEFDNNQSIEIMKYEEFVKQKCPYSYIVQNSNKYIEKYSHKNNNVLVCANMWVNFGNVYTIPHYDAYNNWLCQIKGQKRVILFPPEERDKLYPLNNYSFKLLKKIVNAYNDQFIIHRVKVFTKLECKCINQKPLPEYTASFHFYNSFNLITDNIKDRLFSANCVVPIFQKPEKFKIVDVRTSEYIKTDTVLSPYTILWFMTDGKLYIRNYEYDITEGDCYAFPSSFLYPWKVENAVFVMPDPTTSLCR